MTTATEPARCEVTQHYGFHVVLSGEPVAPRTEVSKALVQFGDGIVSADCRPATETEIIDVLACDDTSDDANGLGGGTGVASKSADDNSCFDDVFASLLGLVASPRTVTEKRVQVTLDDSERDSVADASMLFYWMFTYFVRPRHQPYNPRGGVKLVVCQCRVY